MSQEEMDSSVTDGTSHQTRGCMSKIYIINRAIGGMYPRIDSSYHHDEAEAAEAFEQFKQDVGDDPELIELIRLDTETLDGTYITGWEGTSEDVEDEDQEDSDDAAEDDWIVEGKP